MTASAAIVARLRAAGCVFAEQEAALLIAHTESPELLDGLVAQRVSGVPLEHVLGWVEFCGDRYSIGPGVFVPRPRSAALVREALLIVPAGAVIVDLCCGCGAVGAAVSRRVSGARLVAADIDPRATGWAKKNLDPLGGEVFTGDLYSPLPQQLRGTVDLITVVAPYVPEGELQYLAHEARDFEPHAALSGGADGLDILKRVLDSAPRWLAPSGAVVTEIAEYQVTALRHSIEERDLALRVITDDDGATVAVISLPS